MTAALEPRLSPGPGAPGEVEVWDVAHLRPNPLNPRPAVDGDDPRLQDLARTIADKGVIEPLIITPEGFIVAGHRRHAACLLAGVKRVRVIVRQLTPAEQLELMMVENIQREDLTHLQEANGFRRLLEFEGITVNEAARRLGLTTAYIHARLAILKLAPGARRLFDSHDMQVAAIKWLLKIADPERQTKLALMVKARTMTVQKLGTLVSKGDDLTRAGGRPRRVQKWMQGVAREEAIAMLKEAPNMEVSFAALATLAAEVCCACGLQKSPEVCLSCPLPQFLRGVAVTRARRAGAGA